MQVLSQSPTDPDFVQSPYPFYDRARKAGPFFHWRDYNLLCATTHKAVSQVLKSRQMGRQIPEDRAPNIPDHLRAFYDIEAHSMLELEPPRHTRLRALVVRAFTSRRIAALEGDIAQFSHQLIDAFPDDDFDLIEAFAKWVPVWVICQLLGVPKAHAADLLGWSNAMVAMYQAKRSTDIEHAAATASKEFKSFIETAIADKRAAPTNDLLSELIRAEESGDKLSTDELITTCILLLNAGHEATVHSMGNGTATMLEHNIRQVSEATVEEILRFDPPLHMFTRWVYEDTVIEGQTLKAGQQVACLLAAANRDPAVYDYPGRFRPDRAGPTNVSFGAGIHFCVGAPLARLEMRVALQTLFQRCPNLTLAGQPRYANIYHFHGLERLMVRL